MTKFITARCISLRHIGAGLFALLLGTAVAAQENYSGQTLTDVNFLGQDLSEANFSGATLNGVRFSQANLAGAVFAGATLGAGTLGPTDFSHANLTDANFTDVKFETVVSFQYADISGANFAGIDTGKALFGPHLNLDHSGRPPSFAGAQMDCEFPWHWSHLELSAAHTPDCSNSLTGARGEPPHPPERVKAAGESVLEEVPPTPLAERSLVVIPIERIQPSTDYAPVNNPPAGNTIHVSTTGSDGASCGADTQSACATIARGISRCRAVGTPCSVLIGYGRYRLGKPLDMVDKVSLIGGCVGGKPTVYQSTVVAPAGAGGIPDYWCSDKYPFSSTAAQPPGFSERQF